MDSLGCLLSPPWGKASSHCEWGVGTGVGRVRSGEGKLEKSGEIGKPFPVTRKSGNIDYSPFVREMEGLHGVIHLSGKAYVGQGKVRECQGILSLKS